jgi:hypothetical protein
VIRTQVPVFLYNVDLCWVHSLPVFISTNGFLRSTKTEIMVSLHPSSFSFPCFVIADERCIPLYQPKQAHVHLIESDRVTFPLPIQDPHLFLSYTFLSLPTSSLIIFPSSHLPPLSKCTSPSLHSISSFSTSPPLSYLYQRPSKQEHGIALHTSTLTLMPPPPPLLVVTTQPLPHLAQNTGLREIINPLVAMTSLSLLILMGNLGGWAVS